MYSVTASALAFTRIYTKPECISQQPANHWWHSIEVSYTPATALPTFFTYDTAEGIGSSVHSLDPAPEPSFSFPQTLLLLFTWKILQLLCFLPWTDTVFSMLPPSLLPALRVAIFRPRELACVEPADYPQPLGNLCTMLSIPEARSRHTWPAWSHYGLGRIYLLGSNVPQVFSSWCSDT